jgi:Lipocalin-like domain
MARYFYPLVGAYIALSLCPTPSVALTQDDIAGTWSVVSIQHEEQSGKKSMPLGEHPRGVLIIGTDGRFTAVLVAEGRTPLQNEGSMAELTQSLIAYSARATIEQDSGNAQSLKVTLIPDVSWNPATTGNSDTRSISLQGNRLVVKSTSAGGTETQTYERAARR